MRRKTPQDDESVIRELQNSNGDAPLPFALASAMSGDHELTPEQQAMADDLWTRKGNALFVQLLFTITHQRFPPEEAKDKWFSILRHKYELSQKLGRNVGLAVATLDYLANVCKDIQSPVIISEPSMESILRMAVEDSLTRVANRSAILVRLEDELNRHRRHGTVCSLLLVDIDNFSRINDTLGHDSGDTAIRGFVATMGECLREVDVCGRFGGDEFIALLPDTDTIQALPVADRILTRVRKTGMTCSIGIATCPEHGVTVADLLSASDQALLDAKHQGKDRAVTHATKPPSAADGKCPRTGG